MSIAVVVPELLPVPPVQGGAVEHWVQEAFQRMSGEHTHVTVISRPAGAQGDSRLHHVGIPWTRSERFFARLKDKVTWKNPLRYLAKIQNVWSYGRRAGAALKGMQVDIINIQNEPNLLFFIDKRPGQKLVLHMHNEHLSIPLFRPFYRRALAKVDLVICVSDYIRQRALRLFPEYADKFEVLLNSTEPAIFQPYGEEAMTKLAPEWQREAGKQYLLYVGRLTEIKGVHVLIDAFKTLHRSRPDTRLVIAGSSFFQGAATTPYMRELVEMAEPVKDAIEFTGFLPHEKLKYLYSAADLIVVPSVWQDPCPLVVLEAMSSGTCLVSTAVGGVPELVQDQQTGVLVAPDNAQQIVAAVSDLLDHPEKMRRIERQARARIIEQFSWERLVADLHRLQGSRP